MKQLPISYFLNYELVAYAVANMQRSIPGLDGLKNGQRKIVFGTFDNWGANTGKSTKQEKSNHLGNHVSKVSNYHHGEKSIIDTINKMLANYPGTNNMRYFVPKGMFGTRNAGGTDSGDSRYTYLYPEWWWQYIYHPEDKNLLEAVDDEGPREPKIYPTVLCVLLMNGALGIAVGSSTFIPNFNPIDIAQATKALLMGAPMKPLIPWYRDFKGKVYMAEKKQMVVETGIINVPFSDEKIYVGPRAAEIADEGTENADEGTEDTNSGVEEDIQPTLADIETDKDGDLIDAEGVNGDGVRRPGLKMVTEGCFNIIDNKTIFVDEIPIGKSFIQYNDFLEKKKQNKEIKDYKKTCKGNEAGFYIYGFVGKPTLEALGLVKSFSLTNMVVLDSNFQPMKFKTPNDLLLKFYEWRLPYYSKRKDNLLKVLQGQIDGKIMKIKFITGVIDGLDHGYIPGKNIIIMKQKKIITLKQMADIGIPPEYLKTGSNNYTEEDIKKLEDAIAQLNQKYQVLLATRPEDLWISDINEFIAAYLKKYPGERDRL
jgi:DNA topoisomerase-2